MNHDFVCQVPPAAGHPPDIAARLKKPAYGMNDAPRRWWNNLDSNCVSKWVLHLKKSWIPQLEVQLQKIPWQESSIYLWMIFLEQVVTKWNNAFRPDLRKDSQVGSEDWNDVAFTRQRIRWTQDSQNGQYIEASRNKAIDELEEIPVERNTKKDLHRTPSIHTMYRSLLGQISWLQSGTQFQCCYKMSRCASMAASPTIGDVKSPNKLARQIKSQPVKIQYWPLNGTIENTWIS